MGFEEGTKGHVPLLASTIMFMSTTGWYSHMVTRRERKKKDGPTINIKRPHQYSFMTHSQLIKIIKRIYNWRSTLYKKGNPWFSIPCQFRYQTNKSLTGNANTGTSFQLRDLIVHMKLLQKLFYIEMEYSE
jgi:hypothetical protein